MKRLILLTVLSSSLAQAQVQIMPDFFSPAIANMQNQQAQRVERQQAEYMQQQQFYMQQMQMQQAAQPRTTNCNTDQWGNTRCTTY